jgi:farnesyl-diphosphate farnesyltransferase
VDDALEQLLAETSRTFALTIPYLPEPTRRAVMVAYLIFRIADTLEDSERWPCERKAAELRALPFLLTEGDAAAARAFAERMRADPPTAHAGYLRLLTETPRVLEALHAFPQRTREIIARHTIVTAEGMAASVAQLEDGVLRLTTLQQLREYCYYVAGVVGEMLSELFLADWPALAGAAQALRQDARAFGEGLQLTNILKDAADDAREGRHFLPASIARGELFALARSDLAAAQRYVGALRVAGAPLGVLAFTALPVRLAVATLGAVERRGAGAKVARAEVAQAVLELNDALDRGELPALLARGWMAAQQ